MNFLTQNESTSAAIASIADERIKEPTGMPVRNYLQEAENIYNWCQADREKLVANGMDWQMVEDMPARIDALREAQAIWRTSNSAEVGIEKEWNKQVPAAFALRKELARAIKFAFRDNRTARAAIRRLTSGGSHASLIQSLRDLAIFGMEHDEYLRSKKFNMEKLAAGVEMSRRMGSLLAAVKTGRSFSSKSLKLRNQAYTHLKEAVDELKAHALYLFADDKKRMRGYISEYRKKRYIRIKNREKAIETAESPTIQ
jgi:hypothetical protein